MWTFEQPSFPTDRRVRVRAMDELTYVGPGVVGSTWADAIDLGVDHIRAFPHELNHVRTGSGHGGWCIDFEPWSEEVLGISEKGHDYYLQMTDARPDTGGLSGATPAEAVSWGKVDPEQLPGTVVCYLDNSIGFPILAAYALARHPPRPLKRLYERRDALMTDLRAAYVAAKAERDARAQAAGSGGER